MRGIRVLLPVLVVAVLVVATGVAGTAGTATAGTGTATLEAAGGAGQPRIPPLPAGAAASYTVFDHRTGRVVDEVGQHRRYRSASLVKLLVAVDLLDRVRAPSPADRRLLDAMLRASDDDAASTLWTRGGGPAILARTVRRLDLTDTLPPADPGTWGYTTTSTADVTKTYLYVLDRAPAATRAGVLGPLEGYRPCAADGYDQSFGVPSAVRGPWAVKQGWADWPALPAAQRCRPGPPPGPSPLTTAARKDEPGARAGVRSLHTSGLVDGRGQVVVVLTEVPRAMSFRDASALVTTLTRAVV